MDLSTPVLEHSDNEFGKTNMHRSDPVERLRHRFYEPLLFLWMLNPARGPTFVQPTINQPSHDFFSQWREFLDCLSWMCDFNHGGKTVSAVAGERTVDGTRFWLASKHESALPHLRDILEKLQLMRMSNPNEMVATARAISESSIALSGDKIKNYCRELSRRLGTIEERDDNTDLLSAISAISIMRDQPLEVCRGALSFPEFRTLDRQIEAMTDVRTPTEWSYLRHYLLRLQSWHKKTAVIVHFAARYPSVLGGCSCEWLQTPGDARLPEKDEKTNLLSALKRMLPNDQQQRATELYDSVGSLRDFNFDAAFAKSFDAKGPSLVVHAEVFLMEHFYWNNLRFLENDRYIGCSKRSCYCCSLYIRYHPGNYVLRPSHGTAWVTWGLPLQAKLEDEVVKKHNLEVLNKVVQHLRRDLLNELEVRFPRRQRPPDSTSAFASLSL
ncbi:uncharacterized protein LTR77_002402 [Saxophila tyrrhenica]|uniref:Uncharacterized protein n=1 Tax=Saxophila tyrrhenica TaxID=1690608 RepID=A0AAV9PK86_9PEZI|nr:hypothetical protein LTR77_002402 [Saxophila tyrrhenica]